MSEVPAYSAAVLAFINCLILANEDLRQRVHVRNEIIGMWDENYKVLLVISIPHDIVQQLSNFFHSNH